MNIARIRRVAAITKTCESRLKEIATNPEQFYHRGKRLIKNKQRDICYTKGDLHGIQKRLQQFLSRFDDSPISYGGVKGRTHRMAASLHAETNPGYVGVIDIKSFFPSVTSGHILRMFKSRACSPEVSQLLTKLTTIHGALPTGTSTSPVLANLMLSGVDRRLHQTATSQDLVITRFVDDIAISGDSYDSVTHALGVAIRAIHSLGLRTHYGKTKVMKPGARKEVTNLILASRGRVCLAKKASKSSGDKISRSKIRNHVRHAQKYGITDERRTSLRGMIRYLEDLHPKEAKQRLDELTSAPRLVAI